MNPSQYHNGWRPAKLPPANSTSTSGDQGAGIECRTFTLFAKLPIELRYKIWKEAQPPQRVVDLVFQEHHPDESFSKATQPILLSVCQESRSETHNYYRVFSENIKPGGSYSRCPIYIDPKIDIFLSADDMQIWIDRPDTVIRLDAILSWLNTKLFDCLALLGIGLWLFDEWAVNPSHQPALSPLLKFSALEGLWVVFSPESTQRQRDLVLVNPYDYRLRMPPLLTPDEDDEDLLMATYIPNHLRYVQQSETVENAGSNGLDGSLALSAGTDRMTVIEETLDDVYYEVYAVHLEHTKWELPAVGVGSLELVPDSQDIGSLEDEGKGSEGATNTSNEMLEQS